MEVCSLARGVSVRSLIPYPSHYKMAFAFSIFLYPHLHETFLRSSYLLAGEVWAYHVPRKYQDGLGSACSPMVVVCLRQVNRKHLHPTTYLFGRAFQHLWLYLVNDVYQQFVCTSHIIRP
jgi:hypothetical protein